MVWKKGEIEDIEIGSLISKFNDLSKENKIRLISYFIDELKRLHDVNEQEILGRKEISVPVGIFANDVLSSLEAIVKYLKEELKIKFSKVGKLLNRSNKTIWSTYHNASKKMPSDYGTISHDILIPVSIFSNRTYSVLENVINFLFL